MDPTGEFSSKSRVIELSLISLRNEGRDTCPCNQSTNECHIDTFRLGSQPETFDKRIRYIFCKERTAMGRALWNRIKESREIFERRPRIRKCDPRHHIRL